MIYLALALLLLPPFVHVSCVYTMGLKRARAYAVERMQAAEDEAAPIRIELAAL